MPAVKNSHYHTGLCILTQSSLLGSSQLCGTRAEVLAKGQPGYAGLVGAGLAFTGPGCERAISGLPFIPVFLYSRLPDHTNDADCALPSAVRLKHGKNPQCAHMVQPPSV